MSTTKSEALFELFLLTNEIPFRRIATDVVKTPDYEVKIAGVEIIFEVKELTDDGTFATEVVHSQTVGEHIRKTISGARKQVQSAAKQGKPTVVLIFNAMDPAQLFGTENHDFEHGMHGELTVVLDIGNGKIVDHFHGRNKAFQASKNTSFSALGRLLKERDGTIRLTIFENFHAKVPIQYDALPACFEIVRFVQP